MADDEDNDPALEWPSIAPGTNWTSFFAQCDLRMRPKPESPARQQTDFVSKMPYQSS
jgi:hypothetical protein